MKSATDRLKDVFLKVTEIVLLFINHFVFYFAPATWTTKDVQGEIVLITGAGNGLGRALAIAFGRLQSVVVLWDIDEKNNEETKEMILREGGKAFAYTCDVSNNELVYEVAAKVKKDVGVVTILVNNAAILIGCNFMESEDQHISKTMEINAMGPMWTCKAFLWDMLNKNHGHIVNISSLGGYFGGPKEADYCASKHAMTAFDETLKIKLYAGGYTGVRTTMVCPTYFKSGIYQGLTENSFAPELSVDYVCSKTMEAILSNEEVLILPKTAMLLIFLKSIIPIEIYFRIMSLLGVYDMSKNFKGARDITLITDQLNMLKKKKI